jgi:hypothetical protein
MKYEIICYCCKDIENYLNKISFADSFFNFQQIRGSCAPASIEIMRWPP